MIIGVDMGHTLNPVNYGAIGIKRESEETRKVGKHLIKYLECMGNTVVNVTVDYANTKGESLSKRVTKANSQPLDLFVSLHFNSFDGTRNGSEIYTYRGKRLPQAIRILNNLSSLGFKNNGIFDGSKLYVIRKTKAPAMIIEIAYIDSPKDMKIYNEELVAKAIAEGITGQKVPAKCLTRSNSLEDYNEMNRLHSLMNETKDPNIYKVMIGESMSYQRAYEISLEIQKLGYPASIEAIENI